MGTVQVWRRSPRRPCCCRRPCRFQSWRCPRSASVLLSPLSYIEYETLLNTARLFLRETTIDTVPSAEAAAAARASRRILDQEETAMILIPAPPIGSSCGMLYSVPHSAMWPRSDLSSNSTESSQSMRGNASFHMPQERPTLLLYNGNAYIRYQPSAHG